MGAERPLYVAYVYAGWHRSPWRPHIDEWQLLDNFRSYYDGHDPFPRPVDGTYDDTRPETPARQIAVASHYGIDAFSYFLYSDTDRFIMAEGIDAAFAVAADNSTMALALTWCLRLPHHDLPMPAAFKLYRRRGTVEVREVERTSSDCTLGSVLRTLPPEETDRASVRGLLRLAGDRRRCVD
jgi:hypothetical protein